MIQPELYDYTGTLLPRAGVVEPPVEGYVEAGVDDTVIDRYRGYFSRNLTPWRLASILEQADGGTPAELFLLCDEILEKDMKFASLFQTRTAQITGLNRDVMPPEDIEDTDRALAETIADFCCRAFEQANVNDLVEDMMDAVAKPFSVDWIFWGFDSNNKIVPKQFRKIPGSHLHWGVNRNELRLFDPSNPVIVPGGETGILLDPATTVRSIWTNRRDNPLKSGLMRTLCWYYLFKITAWKDIVSYADRYGMPIRVAKLPQVQFENVELRNKIRDSLRRLGSDGSGVFTAEAELEIIAAAGKGGDVFKTIIDLVNKEAAQLVFGHELSSESSPGSGQLGISAALVQQQHVLEGDCVKVSEIIRRDVLRWMVEWNFGPDAVAKGLVPMLWFDFEAPPDLQGEANYIATVVDTFPSLKISEQQIRNTFGLDEPVDDADSIESAPAAVPGAPPDPEPLVKGELPPPTVHRALARRRRRRGPTRYKQAQQKRIDGLADRSIAGAQDSVSAIQSEIIGVLRSVLADGGSYMEARARLIKTYRTLPVATITELLETGLKLSRLAGRNGG